MRSEQLPGAAAGGTGPVGPATANGPDPDGRTSARMLRISMLVLFLEAALLGVGAVVIGQTRPAPVAGHNALGLLALPFLVAGGAVVGLALSSGLVLPVVRSGELLARRAGGRPLWWQSALAVAATAPVAPFLGPWWWCGGWAALLLAVVVTARARRGGFVTLLAWGTLAVVSAGTLGGAALYSGVLVPYTPPRMSAEALVGSWTDGDGGTLTFTADGRVTARGVRYEEVGSPDSFETVSRECTGTGRWVYQPSDTPWRQSVEVTIDACSWVPWEVTGTDTDPVLYQYLGDPDAWDLYELRRAPR
ncbi:hypothetical protein ABZ135_01540 [Streptomyces sp. NPDC006339]|uniref:hypothetical protein n=1 Tax=Streptomyces sp. NPDC006339 TaxID=3156755 RepID=UPI0033B56A68